MQVRKQQLELDMQQQTGSKRGKEYVKVVYCHPAYLTYMQSTSLRAPQPGGRRKASSLGSRPLPLHPSAEKPQSLGGFPKQPSVRCKSKGQNPEFWPAGPALLLALCRPAGPGAPARMGKGRVRELHPGGRRGSKVGRAPYCPLMSDRICGCPAAWAFSWGPYAITVYR